MQTRIYKTTEINLYDFGGEDYRYLVPVNFSNSEIDPPDENYDWRLISTVYSPDNITGHRAILFWEAVL